MCQLQSGWHEVGVRWDGRVDPSVPRAVLGRGRRLDVGQWVEDFAFAGDVDFKAGRTHRECRWNRLQPCW